VKERPILMSAPMVRALLAGTKTQTRRVARLSPMHMGMALEPGEMAHGTPLKTCPYGQRGERLWVREAWRSGKLTDRFAPREMTPHVVWYEADGQAPEACSGKLRPGMFMPRWASRITLEVTGVRVERLQDISEADARAEGVEPADEPNPLRWQHYSPHGVAYAKLWDSINGPGAWDSNPFVWCVSFRRVDADQP